MLSTIFAAASLLPLLVSSQQLIQDPGKAGPELELMHLYYDEWPTGIAVSSTGRKFSNYPGALDKNNTNNGSNNKYTVAELTGNSTEAAYPNAEWNNPQEEVTINYTTTPPTGANYQNHFIGVQSVVVDPLDRLWVLDTGRVQDPNGTIVNAAVGGPKLVGIDLSNNTVFQTIVFPANVAPGDSYLNDVRFDLRPNITSSGKGVAYITDSSIEGRTGLVIVDLGTGESWRHLQGSTYVAPAQQFLAYIWGVSFYNFQAGQPLGYQGFGADGIALSADGEDLFFGGVGKRYLYSVPTARLRDDGPFSEALAQASVVSRGQKGVSDGYETDTNGYIYHGNAEQNAISFYNPANGTDSLFVRDARINWVDTLPFGPLNWPGTDRRQRPFALFRVKLPNNGTKTSLR
ncbi:unnamed protein product [Aureobasidium vineae]|uniref:Major royal jelly protein n=1 Tax=Aureobasidium vineae TaxID=2773715 RepID=A0A9N8J8I2_9PEZI|nr:unnamed protein product [Aureobasidium vineae]